MTSQSGAEICSAEACPRQWVGDEPPRYEVVIARHIKGNQKAKVKMQNDKAKLNKRLKCKRQKYKAKIKDQFSKAFLSFELSF